MAHTGRPMVDSPDVRARRTRARLLAAFNELARTGPAERISVSELTRAAGVNRTSFYAHFASPEEVAVAAIAELFAGVSLDDTDLRTHGTEAALAARRALEHVVAFVDEGRGAWAHLLGPEGSPAARRAVEDHYAAEAQAAIDRYAERPAGIDVALAARYAAAGVIGAIGDWLAEGPDRRAPEALVEQLFANLPSWMTTDPHH